MKIFMQPFYILIFGKQFMAGLPCCKEYATISETDRILSLFLQYFWWLKKTRLSAVAFSSRSRYLVGYSSGHTRKMRPRGKCDRGKCNRGKCNRGKFALERWWVRVLLWPFVFSYIFFLKFVLFPIKLNLTKWLGQAQCSFTTNLALIQNVSQRSSMHSLNVHVSMPFTYN